MCTLKELQDGTYSLYDLEILHQVLELRDHMKPSAAPKAPQQLSINPNTYV